MGGIVGFSTRSNKYSLEDLESMLEKVKHRGPDSQKTYHDKNVYLGQTYLSQTDNYKESHEIRYESFLISFDGKILNKDELKNKLESVGHNFISNSDEELVVKAYKKWGKDCLTYFRGMWSFVIYDEEKKEFFGSRDRFGIKPLYYLKNDEIFAFSSEIKPLISLPGIQVKPNMSAVSSYLVANLMNYNHSTFFENIYQLEPSNYFIYKVRESNLIIEKYYDLHTEYLKHGEINQEKFEVILDDSLLIHGTSDVPIGTSLSGGLDSSTITAIASKISNNHQLRTITAQSESAVNDETKYAEIVAEHLHLKLDIVKPTYEDFKAEIEKALYIQEEPIGGPSVFMQYNVLKHASDINLKVILDGQGGDEILLGYERYYAFYLFDLFKKGLVIKTLKEYKSITKNSKLSSKDLLKFIFYFNNLTLRRKHLSSRHRTMKKEYLQLGLRVLNEQDSNKCLLDMQLGEITKTNMPTLLKVADRNAMAASVEVRFPFIDHIVIEHALNIKPMNKIRDGYTKFNLRQYLDKKLPESIVWRKNKMGFEAPTNLWMENHKSIIHKEVRNSDIIKKIYSEIPDLTQISFKELWKLYNISVWEKQYFN